MSPQLRGGVTAPRQTRMIDSGTLSPKVAVPTSVLVLIGAILAVLDTTGVLDLDDSLWIALLSAGGVTGTLGYSARPGAVVTDTRARAPRAGERGYTRLELLATLFVVFSAVVMVIALIDHT